MATILPEIDVEKVKRYCRGKVPERLKDEVRIEASTRGRSISIHECRPIWKGAPGEWTKTSVAQLRYEGDGTWTLYCADRNNKWFLYFDLDSHQPVDVILEEIETDPTGIFWG